jgi:hypothetical protein
MFSINIFHRRARIIINVLKIQLAYHVKCCRKTFESIVWQSEQFMMEFFFISRVDKAAKDGFNEIGKSCLMALQLNSFYRLEIKELMGVALSCRAFLVFKL